MKTEWLSDLISDENFPKTENKVKAYLHTLIISDIVIDFEDDIISGDNTDLEVKRTLSITISSENIYHKLIYENDTDIDLLISNLRSLRDELDSFIKHIEHNNTTLIRPGED